MAGLVFVRPDLYEALWARRSAAGGILDPMSAWLLLRSLLTYDLRLERQLRNTQQVLRYLSGAMVEFFYPPAALPWHEHGGAVVSFLAEGTLRELTDKCGRLKTCRMAPSFGGVVSLIECPATMSRYGLSHAELIVAGIEPNLIRLAVGIEPIERILEDIDTLC